MAPKKTGRSKQSYELYITFTILKGVHHSGFKRHPVIATQIDLYCDETFIFSGVVVERSLEVLGLVSYSFWNWRVVLERTFFLSFTNKFKSKNFRRSTLSFFPEMDHKYKSLLRNLPTRHIIVRVNETSIKEQLIRLRNLEIVNFFILGNLTTIKNVLEMANINKYFDRKFAWHVITQVGNMNIESSSSDV